MALLPLELATNSFCEDILPRNTMTLADKCRHCCAVFHELRNFQRDELLCDVNVKTGKRRQSVKAHRVVLLSRKSLDSDYQSDMDSASDTDADDESSFPTMSCCNESVFEEAYASDDEAAQATKQMEHINSLRRRGECCDVTLQASGVEFIAHRCVLAAASEYFKIMFTSSMKEKHMQYIKINFDQLQFDDANLQMVLEYIYTGDITLDDENIMHILCLSAFFQIETLINKCQNYLISQISRINCCGFYVLAKCFALQELKSGSCQIIHDHFPELEGISDDINLLDSVDLAVFLRSDDLGQGSVASKRNESQVLSNVMDWLSSAEFGDVAKVLTHVRFSLIPKKSIETYQKMIAKSNYADYASAQGAEKFFYKALEYHERLYEQPLLQTSNSQLRVSKPTWVCVDGVLAPEAVRLPSTCLHAKSPITEQENGSSHKIRDPFHSIVVLNGFIYVIGGTRQTALGYSTEVLRYDSRLDTWVRVAPMNEERGDFFACTIGDCIYVFGGRNRRGATSSSERYDPKRNCWERVRDIPEALYMTAGVVHNGKVYLSGGFNDYEAVGITLQYDPETNEWNDLRSVMCKDRGYHVLLNDAHGYLWAIGGVDNPFAGRNVWDVERFDLENEMWEYVGQVLAVKPFLSVQRLNAFEDKRGRICVFAVTNIDHSPVLSYDIEQNLWETLNEPMDYFEIDLNGS